MFQVTSSPWLRLPRKFWLFCQLPGNEILTPTKGGYGNVTPWLYEGNRGGVCPGRSPRSSIFPPNDPSPSEQHLRMISPHCNGDTIGQAERNSVRFGKQKAQATCRGSSRDAFMSVGKLTSRFERLSPRCIAMIYPEYSDVIAYIQDV